MKKICAVTILILIIGIMSVCLVACNKEVKEVTVVTPKNEDVELKNEDEEILEYDVIYNAEYGYLIGFEEDLEPYNAEEWIIDKNANCYLVENGELIDFNEQWQTIIMVNENFENLGEPQ